MSEHPRANWNDTAHIKLLTVFDMFGHSFLCRGLMPGLMAIMEIGCSVWWGTAKLCQCSHINLAQGDLAYIRPELIILKLA